MNHKNFINFIESNNSPTHYKQLNTLFDCNVEYKDWLLESTSFLPIDYGYSIRIYCIYNNLKDFPSCPICSSPITSKGKTPDSSGYIGFAKTCGKTDCVKKHRFNSMVKTNIELYGEKTPFHNKEQRNKARETCLQRYGTEYASSSEIIKQRIKDTSKEKYGVEHFLKSKEVKNKIKNSNIEKFGVNYPMQSEEVKETTKENNLKKYGVDHPMKLDINKEKVSNTIKSKYRKGSYQQIWGFDLNVHEILFNKEMMKSLYENNGSLKKVAESLNVSEETIRRRLKEHGIKRTIKSISLPEKELLDFIKDHYKGEVLINDRSILKGKEIDIYIPALKLAIEFNGIYWHSIIHKDKYYHANKTIECMNNGIRLIHIWEDEWSLKKDQIKSKLLYLLGKSNTPTVYARNSKVKTDINSNMVKKLMETHHIQGFVGANKHIGLVDENNILVAVMSLKYNNDDIEIVRYATSCKVVGGFSKLLSFVEKNNVYKTITTYASLDKSYGELYEKTGFEKLYITEPAMFYVDVKKVIRHRREKFMKHKLKYLLENFDPSLTEWENLERHGIFRLYDSGLIKYRKKA